MDITKELKMDIMIFSVDTDTQDDDNKMSIRNRSYIERYMSEQGIYYRECTGVREGTTEKSYVVAREHFTDLKGVLFDVVYQESVLLVRESGEAHEVILATGQILERGFLINVDERYAKDKGSYTVFKDEYYTLLS